MTVSRNANGPLKGRAVWLQGESDGLFLEPGLQPFSIHLFLFEQAGEALIGRDNRGSSRARA